jgi:BASS family bile acid:Na+ symporter
MNELDNIQLNFGSNTVTLMNVSLGIIMFGVALALSLEDFKRLLKMPKLVIVGFLAQFLVLPLITFLFVSIVKPIPSVALGMFLVAACPGGNISNFIATLSKANAALSVTLTAIATTVAAFLTPLNFTIWANLYADTQPLLKELEVDLLDMLIKVFMLLGIPLILGLSFKYKFPKLTEKIIKPIQRLSLVIFLAFIVFAFLGNWKNFLDVIHLIFFLVLIHNLIAFITGYSIGQLLKFEKAAQRTVAIETGIQNAGLGLIIAIDLFDGLGGMIVVLAWYGIWDMIAGLGLAFFWSKR